ncbi:NAD(P)/FAD-dependent oxidoreductase [Paenirhodobacter populi]|uniref:NAD(P)/FAD-dependent oxidoreductase n=1 Tax=Paenirhodobacter populi TaxID=2306993 RepID=A0A443J9E1_9RHOB|nr:NAD(P)/FAD-dependent oxidoreductase [Sinirhodobacter populi]RWR05629.1 NAD(P)/FAD-dependent oxidoreductase [Sinirhodobacter populi]RWR17152.1 NAD(P)/FAD-dependent oxidoreductase [Sinirhodobacter populi]
MLDSSSQEALTTLVTKLEDALIAQDAERVAGLFAESGFWRDLTAFTWNIKTCEGRTAIRDMADAQLPAIRPRSLRLNLSEPITSTDGVVEGWLTFETETGRGVGHIRIKDGEIWTFMTALHELKGHEETCGSHRPFGAEHGHDPKRRTWKEKLADEAATLGYETQPYVLIIGGGQGGIALGARLRQLGVSTIIIDRHARPGDQWRSRYKSLCLHDPVWYDHLPYIPFPPNWPIFTPKDKIGDWLEMYTKVMELNYWSKTRAKSASWNDDRKEWTVTVDRDGQEVTLHPKQLVMATGMSGKPSIPRFPGQDVFRGEQQHSSQHPGPDAYRGKKVVVIGSNNSAHDICAALWEGGADVTMVQRSSTLVVKSSTLMDVCMKDSYSEQALAKGITTEKADLTAASIPYAMLPEIGIREYEEIRRRDADFYTALEKVGFMLDFGEDGSGLAMKYMRRGSGYYIDVGACDLVIDGSIKLKSGVGVDRLTEDAVVLSDGTELPADLVVYATGFGPMNEWAAELISQEVADKVGRCWGLGSGTTRDPEPWEGELRNMWKPTMQEGLWFHGGNLSQSRHYSRYLALQLKAREAGLYTPVWDLSAPHHTR